MFARRRRVLDADTERVAAGFGRHRFTRAAERGIEHQVRADGALGVVAETVAEHRAAGELHAPRETIEGKRHLRRREVRALELVVDVTHLEIAAQSPERRDVDAERRARRPVWVNGVDVAAFDSELDGARSERAEGETEVVRTLEVPSGVVRRSVDVVGDDGEAELVQRSRRVTERPRAHRVDQRVFGVDVLERKAEAAAVAGLEGQRAREPLVIRARTEAGADAVGRRIGEVEAQPDSHVDPGDGRRERERVCPATGRAPPARQKHALPAQLGAREQRNVRRIHHDRARILDRNDGAPDGRQVASADRTGVWAAATPAPSISPGRQWRLALSKKRSASQKSSRARDGFDFRPAPFELVEILDG